MARLEIHFPEIIHFTTEIPVRISDLNYGNHLGNDALVSILHEARVQFLKKYNYTEMNIEGVGIIMADLAVQYKSEVFYNDVLKIEMSIKNFTRVGFEIFYRVSCSQKNIALAKTGIVCFDYEKKKIVALPLRFEKIFSPN